MNILIDSIRQDTEYRELSRLIKKNFSDKPFPCVAGGLCDGASDALIMSLLEDTLGERKLPALVVCSEEKECLRLQQLFEKFGFRAAFYIARDLTFHNIVASHEYEHERLRVLSGIISGAYDVVFTTPDTALGFTIPREKLESNIIDIDYDTVIPPSELAKRLVDAGYIRVDMVEGQGQFAVRGGIVDVYPPMSTFVDNNGAEYKESGAIRIEFFDDEIDRLGVFDIDTQRLIMGIKSLKITPARELLINDKARERLVDIITKEVKNASDAQTKQILNSELAAVKVQNTEIKFADKYISSIYPEKQTLLDYFTERTLFVIRSSAKVKERLKSSKWHEEEMIKSLCSDGLINPKIAEYSKPAAALDLFSSTNVTIHVDSLAYGATDKRLSGLFGFRTRQPVTYVDNFNLLCEDILGYLKGKYKVIIMAENEQSAHNLREMLEEADFNAVCEDAKKQVSFS